MRGALRYVGIVEEVGDDVTTIEQGQFLLGSFRATDTIKVLLRP